MAKKLRTDDIVEKGLFEKPVEETRAFLKVVKELKKEVKVLGDELQKAVGKNSPLNDSSEVEKFRKEMEELKIVTSELKKLEQQEAKLKAKLIDQTKQEAIEKAKLRVQIQEGNKALKEEAKEQLGLLSTYQKQSKRLNELRKKYKNLVLEQGKNAQGAKELKKEIQELDKALKDVDADVGQFQRSVGNYEKINSGAKSSFGSLSAFLLGIFAGSLQKTRTGGRELQIILEKVKNSVSALGKAFSDIVKPGLTVFNLFSRISNAFTVYANNIGESNDKLEEQLRLTDRYIDQISMLEFQISKLIGEEEKQQVIADDTTKSFKERESAIRRVLELQDERLGKEEEIAKKELELARKSIENDFIKSGLKAEFNELNAKGNIDNLEFLKNQEQADAISLENLEKLKTATLALQDVDNQRAKLEQENEKTTAELKQDRLERDLDILIDGFDNQKTINERIIADERRTLAEREALLEDTIERGNNSFEKQKEILNELSEAGIDYNELLGLDAEALNKRIRELEQSEIIEGRTLEVIRERRLVLQDLEEARQEINEAKRQEVLLEVELKGLEENKSDAEISRSIRLEKIKQLKKEISELEKDDLRAIEKKIELEKLEREDEESKEEARKKLIQETTTFIQNELKKRTDLRTKALNEEIDASKEREQQLRDAAANGNLLAEESIAVEKERQAKLTAEREKALKRQKQIEISLAAINAYSNRSRQGDENALGKTIGDITALLSFANNLPAFEDGGLVTGGEQIVRINEKGQEYVIKHDAVNKYGTDMLDAINTGDFSKMEVNRGSGGQTDFNIMMNQALDKVAVEFKKAVSEIPQQRWSMSEITGGLKEEIEKGNQLKSRHYRKQKRLS